MQSRRSRRLSRRSHCPSKLLLPPLLAPKVHLHHSIQHVAHKLRHNSRCYNVSRDVGVPGVDIHCRGIGPRVAGRRLADRRLCTSKMEKYAQ